MHNPRLGLIRILTTDNLDLLQSHERIIKKAFPQITIESRCIPDQFDGVHDDESEALAIPKVASLGRQFAQEGFDAVYVSCVGDPGVALLQKELSIPVIGAGRATGHVISACQMPVGALSITDDAPGVTPAILGDLLLKTVRPEKIHTTLDLFRPEAEDELVSAGLALKELGAKGILLACTGLSTIGSAPKLQERLGLTIFDPLRCALGVIWAVLCAGEKTNN